ncbi:MAG: hypothetical protein FWG75_07905 [Cystobacterineae bacterium]|nr:hypothetical protein [Cystobacterineae bacterium]
MRTQKWGPVVVLALFASGCNEVGVCKVGRNNCPSDTVCYGGEGVQKGPGVCTLGELSAEYTLVPKLKQWRLLLSNQAEVVPLAWDSAEEPSPPGNATTSTEWVNKRAATLEAEVVGLKPDEKPSLWVEGEEIACASSEVTEIEDSRAQLWSCALPEAWLAPALPEERSAELLETVKLSIQPGAGAPKRERIYRVDIEAPRVGLMVFSGTKCRVGNNCADGSACLGIGGTQQAGMPGTCGSPAFDGTTVHVCAQIEKATETQSKIVGIETPYSPWASTEPLEGVVEIAWVHEGGAANTLSTCWTGTTEAWPQSLESLYFSLEVGARDEAENLFKDQIYGSFQRLSCSAQVEGLSANAVKAPLAFSNGFLTFGSSMGAGALAADNALYFVDAEACELHSNVHVGAVQGPMVVLGHSGQIALALGEGGPPGRSTPRLSVVNAPQAHAAPGFSNNSEMDCVPGTGGSHPEALFDKGLSLIMDNPNGPNWYLAAPANSALEGESRLMVFGPNIQRLEGRCIEEDKMAQPPVSERFTLTPLHYVGYGDIYGHNIASFHEAKLNRWWFCENCAFNPSDAQTYDMALKKPSGAAVGRYSAPTTVQEPYEYLWLSGDGLLYADYFLGMETVLQERTSPAVVDSQNRAYVAVGTRSGHEMWRFSEICFVGDINNNPCRPGNQPLRIPPEDCFGLNGDKSLGAIGLCRASSVSFDEDFVGSPLLGERAPGSPYSEMYVVSTNGTVLALEVDSLGPLWVQSLGMRVLPTAQPVLVPHPHGGGTLWVVGAQGQVRGLRVNSPGLSRTAIWPKAFRDNCNTSSTAVSSSNTSMSSCF